MISLVQRKLYQITECRIIIEVGSLNFTGKSIQKVQYLITGGNIFKVVM